MANCQRSAGNQKETDCRNGTIKNISLPESDVLQFFTDDGSKISIRPSGTEPKIKFYFSVKEKLTDKIEFDSVSQRSDEKIEGIKKSLLNNWPEDH